MSFFGAPKPTAEKAGPTVTVTHILDNQFFHLVHGPIVPTPKLLAGSARTTVKELKGHMLTHVEWASASTLSTSTNKMDRAAVVTINKTICMHVCWRSHENNSKKLEYKFLSEAPTPIAAPGECLYPYKKTE